MTVYICISSVIFCIRCVDVTFSIRWSIMPPGSWLRTETLFQLTSSCCWGLQRTSWSAGSSLTRSLKQVSGHGESSVAQTGAALTELTSTYYISLLLSLRVQDLSCNVPTHLHTPALKHYTTALQRLAFQDLADNAHFTTFMCAGCSRRGNGRSLDCWFCSLSYTEGRSGLCLWTLCVLLIC